MTKPTTPLPLVKFASPNHAMNFIEASMSDLGGEVDAVKYLRAHIQTQAKRISEKEAERDGYLRQFGEMSNAAHSANARAEAAETELALVRDWARGRCECCYYGINETEKTDESCKSYRKGCNWTPAWEVER